MYSVHIHISVGSRKRGTTKMPTLSTIKEKPLTKKKQKTVRPLFLEPEPQPPAVPSPQPPAPLPVSPPPSPTQHMLEEEDEVTLRPTIAVDLPVTKRALRTVPADIPTVDSFICSPGFRPDDDRIVENKRYQREAERMRWEEEEDDDDGWSYYRRSYWTPPKTYFTDAMGKQMVAQFGKLIDGVCTARPEEVNAGVERFLDAMACSDYMAEFLDWAPRFRTMLEAKLEEFTNHPKAPLRILGLCQLLRDRHF